MVFEVAPTPASIPIAGPRLDGHQAHVEVQAGKLRRPAATAGTALRETPGIRSCRLPGNRPRTAPQPGVGVLDWSPSGPLAGHAGRHHPVCVSGHLKPDFQSNTRASPGWGLSTRRISDREAVEIGCGGGVVGHRKTAGTHVNGLSTPSTCAAFPPDKWLARPVVTRDLHGRLHPDLVAT